ncbi:multiprotein bridging factor aMBF1 [Stetteria hydrogenophila]
MTRRSGQQLYCEMCGAPIAGRPYYAIVDGVEMVLCASCYLKLYRSGRAKPVTKRREESLEKSLERVRRVEARARRPSIGEYEIVEDYAERVREAVERAMATRGWSRAVIAQRLRISESLLRKIEQGRVKPSIDLARRIESLLGVKLVERVEEEEEASAEEFYPTLGDVVVVRRDED